MSYLSLPTPLKEYHCYYDEDEVKGTLVEPEHVFQALPSSNPWIRQFYKTDPICWINRSHYLKEPCFKETSEWYLFKRNFTEYGCPSYPIYKKHPVLGD